MWGPFCFQALLLDKDENPLLLEFVHSIQNYYHCGGSLLVVDHMILHLLRELRRKKAEEESSSMEQNVKKTKQDVLIRTCHILTLKTKGTS